MIPLVGTVMGAVCVFFLRRGVLPLAEVSIQGISSGVMTAASVWSLLIPAVEMSIKRGRNPLVLTSVGFVLGVLTFIACEKLLELMKRQKSSHIRYGKSFLPSLAVALHNLPEGMAVGAVFAEALCFCDTGALYAAMALSVGIAVQNIPEGAIISLPLYSDGMKKGKAFLWGAGSGVIEPIGAVATIFASELALPILPLLLSFAAGAMVYAVLDCIFQLGNGGKTLEKYAFSLCFSIGFILMMSLDVLLG